MSDDDNQHRGPRHAAAWYRGLRLGMVAFVFALVLPSWAARTIWLFLHPENFPLVDGEGLNYLLWGLAGYAAIPVAITLGVWAIRKDRALGKVLGILAIAIPVLIVGAQVAGVVFAEYAPQTNPEPGNSGSFEIDIST